MIFTRTLTQPGGGGIGHVFVLLSHPLYPDDYLNLLPGISWELMTIVDGFNRGDCNADEVPNVADVVFLYDYLFTQGTVPICDDACDINDDGTLNVADGIYLLSYLFTQGPPLPDPFNVCTEDPTADFLECAEVPPCP